MEYNKKLTEAPVNFLKKEQKVLFNTGTYMSRKLKFISLTASDTVPFFPDHI